MNKKWLIGVHFHTGFEESRRKLNGIAQYVKENPSIELRDYNFYHNDLEASGDPPWKDRVNGVVANAGRSPGIVEWLRRGNAPLVNSAGDLCHERSLGAVFTDTHSLVTTATNHLLELGRKSIGFIGNRHVDLSFEIKKFFAKSLATQQLMLQSYDTHHVLTGSFSDYVTLDKVEPKLLQFLKKIEKPCVFFCLSDRYAATIERIVTDLGAKVPEEVAVLGIGDLEVARQAEIPLSSIRTDQEQVGYVSLRLLHERLMHGRFLKRIVRVPIMELIPRQSTIGNRQTACMDMERALQFIRQRAAEKTRVADVAAYMQMPLRTFELEFAKTMGYSVGQEIRTTRLKRVQELLQTTQLSLRSIAKLVGLTDAANLNRYFVRWSKQTASEYREAHRQS
jgi:AraC-like DNA-binding protein